MSAPAATPAAPSYDVDEETLRRLFPNAPEDVSVPDDVGVIFRRRMSEVWGKRRIVYWIGIGVFAVLAIGSLLGGSLFAAIGCLAVPAIIAIVVAIVQRSRAANDFFETYANARGLRLVDAAFARPSSTPLLGLGSEREFSRVMDGTIAGQPAQLAHYTYTVVTHDDNGRHETDHDYTVVSFPLPDAVAARYRGIYLRERSWSLGSLQDKLSHDHSVELESREFNKRYNLRAVDDQDEVALYELFSPTFIDLLATRLEIHWEQVGSHLLVYCESHQDEVEDLDKLCLRAWHVLHRYQEEWR